MAIQPDKPKVRIDLLDALRGFALLGILLAHISHSFAAGPLPNDVHTIGGKIATGEVEKIGLYKISEFINAAFVNGKFYPLFTFIFGFSFFLQDRSFERDGKNVNLLFLRRAIFLLAIGFIHQLFWMGDILMVYGILMLPLMFMRRLGNKALMALGLLLVFNIPGILIEIYQVHAHARVGAEDSQQADIFLHVISKGSLGEIFSFNYMNLGGKLKFQAISGRFFITLGFFFLGMLTARKGWLSRVTEMKNKVYYIFLPAYALMILLQWLTMKLNYADTTNNLAEILVGNIIISLQSLCAIVLYTSFVAILYFTNAIHKMFKPLANLGRTALTSYLMQTAFGLLLFYNIGFGLFGKTSPTINVVIGMSFFVAQLLLTNIWFRYFNYGIVEWLLRGATFWEFQKLKK